MLGVYASALSEKRNAFLRLLNTKSFRERNKKVAMHPCREHLCVPDARRGGTRGHTWPSRGASKQDVARDGRDGDGRGRWGSGVSSYAHPFGLSLPRGAPGSIRSRDVRATFLLRFQPLSTIQQQYLLALGISATYFIAPQSG